MRGDRQGLQSGSNGVGCAFNHAIANDDPLYKHQSNLNGSIFERRWKRIVNDLAEQVLLQKRMVGAPKADRKLFLRMASISPAATTTFAIRLASAVPSTPSGRTVEKDICIRRK